MTKKRPPSTKSPLARFAGLSPRVQERVLLTKRTKKVPITLPSLRRPEPSK